MRMSDDVGDEAPPRMMLFSLVGVVTDNLRSAGCGLQCSRFLLRDSLIGVLVGRCCNLIGCEAIIKRFRDAVPCATAPVSVTIADNIRP